MVPQKTSWKQVEVGMNDGADGSLESEFALMSEGDGITARMLSYVDRHGRRSSDPIAQARIELRVYGLVSAKRKLNIIAGVRANRPDAADALEVVTREVRLSVIAGLMVGGEWHEPWIGLMRQEFPGDEDPDRDIDPFKPFLLDIGLAYIAADAESSHAIEEVNALLAKYGLSNTFDPLLPIFMASRIVGPLRTQADEFTRLDFLNTVEKFAYDPSDPAWDNLISSLMND